MSTQPDGYKKWAITKAEADGNFSLLADFPKSWYVITEGVRN